MEKALVHIFKSLQLENTGSSSEEKFQTLVNYLDHLVTYDFNKLLSILYRVDVSEEKVKSALADKKEEETNGSILAKLLIERETEKLKWRAKYRKDSKS